MFSQIQFHIDGKRQTIMLHNNHLHTLNKIYSDIYQ